MYNLLIQYFDHWHDQRNKDFQFCLEHNLENPYIKKVYLFYENLENIKNQQILINEKIVVIPIKERASYKQLIDYSNENLKNEICILANTDIYFDGTIQLLDKIWFDNKIIVLTPYENGELRRIAGECSDSWIFKSPIKNFNSDIKMGISFCESLFIIEARKVGLDIENPCLSIKSHHEHHDINGEYITKNLLKVYFTNNAEKLKKSDSYFLRNDFNQNFHEYEKLCEKNKAFWKNPIPIKL